MILRPYGLVVDGDLEIGLELVLEQGVIQEIRPHTGVPGSFVVSPAFVNAHSHFEYRGMQDQLEGQDYTAWIRELTQRKAEQSMEEVREDCLLAAEENRESGIAMVLEHSDRPYSGAAMRQFGLRGAIMQEVITLFEQDAPEAKLQEVRSRADANRREFGGPVYLSPHAFQTVDAKTLASLGAQGQPVSIHVAETEHENEFTRRGEGPIAEFFRRLGIPFQPTGASVVQSLADLDLIRVGSQLVHCCALEAGDVEVIARSGASVAHCPRSNFRLRCPVAPVSELLSAGVRVGLGLDSAASGGPIDMFDEMRAALTASLEIGNPLTPKGVWRMATGAGHASISAHTGDSSSWEIAVGSSLPLIEIHVAGASGIEDLITEGGPEKVRWVVEKADLRA